MTTVISFPIPDNLYHRLQETAVRLQKPVSELVTETLQAALPLPDDIPADIRAEVTALDSLNNEDLQTVAQSEMVQAEQNELEKLVDYQGIRPLTPSEMTRLETLQQEYGRTLLRKARAYALLAARGNALPLN